jgi:type IV pilus assembly protein PilV
MRGISLIEMLVALLVLSFGLLGLAGLQATSLRNNTSALFRSQANAVAFDIMDRMRANKIAAVCNGAYATAIGTIEDNTATIPKRDLTEWKGSLAQLPAGDGAVACALIPGAGCPLTPRAVCTVTVQWDDTRGVGAPQQFVLSAEL